MSRETEPQPVDAGATEQLPAQLAVLKRSMIVRSRTNPRTTFDQAYIAELGADIKARGFLQPILVRPLPADRLQETFEDRQPGQPLPTHEIVCGECRWRGAGLEDIEDIPVMIRNLGDSDVLQAQLVENLKRKDLHPLEEAEGFDRLVKDHHMTREQVASSVKKSVSYVDKSLKLLDLTPECRQQMQAGKLDRSVALLVARAPAHLQAKIAEDIMEPNWQGESMTFRAAAKHIQERYMLQLSAAIFNIADASLVPKAGDCKACPKRTGANTDLFEDVKSADTCTDPKCFDAKKEAHYAAVAKAAAAKGQKVIQGKEAKELMPHEGSRPSGYTLLDEKEYIEGRHVSIRAAIGKANLPAPVLIVNPHTKVVQEALPTDVASKLLAKAKREKKAEKADAAANKVPSRIELERAFADVWQDAAVTEIHRAIAAGAMQSMSVAIARHIALRYAHDIYAEPAARFAKLFGIDSKVGRGDAITTFIKECADDQVAPALLMLMIEEDLDDGYGRDDSYPVVEQVATEAGVDLKALQDQVKADMKAKAAAAAAEQDAQAPAAKTATPTKKKAATPKGTVGKKGLASFMQPLTVSPELAAIVGAGPMVRTEIVSKLWAYIKKRGLQDKENKRMLNMDAALQLVFGKAQISMFEMAGLLGEHVGGSSAKAPAAKKHAGKGKTGAAEAKAGIAAALQAQEQVDEKAPGDADTQPPKIGLRVRIKEGLRGPAGAFRKICGREGKLVTTTPGGGWTFRGDGDKGAVVVRRDDFVVIEPLKAAGDPSKKTTIDPQSAWPFPTKPAGKGAASNG